MLPFRECWVYVWEHRTSRPGRLGGSSPSCLWDKGQGSRVADRRGGGGGLCGGGLVDSLSAFLGEVICCNVGKQ